MGWGLRGKGESGVGGGRGESEVGGGGGGVQSGKGEKRRFALESSSFVGKTGACAAE